MNIFYVYVVMERRWGRPEFYVYADRDAALKHFYVAAARWGGGVSPSLFDKFENDFYFKADENFECGIYKEVVI